MTDQEKKALILGAAGLGALILLGRKSMGKQLDFVIRHYGDAQRVSRDTGLPTALFLTTAALESGWGQSKLAKDAYNFYGFTGDSWKKAGKPVVEYLTTEWKEGKPYQVKRPFRRYASAEESMRDYARLLTSYPRYAAVVVASKAGNLAEAFKALGSSGYATDPKYGDKLAGVHGVLVRGVDQYAATNPDARRMLA